MSLIYKVIAIAVGLIYFYILSQYSFNFPLLDDYEVCLEFPMNFFDATSLFDKVLLLFAQHSEHRLFFTRTVVLLMVIILGQVNFIELIFVGNFALILTILMIVRTASLSKTTSHFWYIPLSFIFFNYSYSEASYWAMTSIQSFWVLTFAFGSLYFLSLRGWYSVFLALLLGWMATYTSGNGMLIFISGIILNFVTGRTFSRRGGVWALAAVFSVVSYLYGYEKPSYHPEIISTAFKDPAGFMGYILSFLGSSVSQNILVSILVGGVIIGSVIILSRLKYYEKNPIHFSLMIFILLSSMVTALARFGFGIEQSLSSRYAIYPTLILSLIYIAFIRLFQFRLNKWIGISIVIISMSFHMSTYHKFIPYRALRKIEYVKLATSCPEDPKMLLGLSWIDTHPQKDLPFRVLRASEERGYFSFSCYKNRALDVPNS